MVTDLRDNVEPLTDGQRETVYLLAEALIPEHQDGPSADQAGVATMFIDTVLELRDDLAGEFHKLLDAAQGRDPREFCEALEESDTAAFSRFTFVIAGAYLMSPKARSWLSYEGQVGEFQDGSDQPEYSEGGLLEVVKARGTIFRPSPNTKGAK
jgi:hypothetical protein